MPDLLEVTPDGIYCRAGGFYVDPWGAVEHAVITHAHSDHVPQAAKRYLAARAGVEVLRARVGLDAAVEGLGYGESVRIGDALVSLHPAGHVLGSAQVRIEQGGEVWVVSGDYKVDPDPTCAAFEPVRCHTFVSESTFGLPIYRWPKQWQVFDEIHTWWRGNQDNGKASLLFAYALGKAQRVLAGMDGSIGPIYAHGAVERVNRLYREAGVPLPPTLYPGDAPVGTDWSRALILAPPSSNGTPWMRRFGHVSRGFVSGWMRIRGARRRRSLDRGFVLSDHADWAGLLASIEASGAERVWVTHGYRLPLVKWLRNQGLDAHAVETRFEGERDEGDGDAPQPEAES